MTLADWTALSGIKPTHPTTEKGAVSVCSNSMGNPYHAELWRLSDYKVSSVSGPVVWLVPHPKDETAFNISVLRITDSNPPESLVIPVLGDRGQADEFLRMLYKAEIALAARSGFGNETHADLSYGTASVSYGETRWAASLNNWNTGSED